MIRKGLLSTWVIGVTAALGPKAVGGELHTVRFLDPTAVPTGHLPDTGGILHPTSHNFQEDGVHVEAIWAPWTHVGFAQGHFHHIENGFETTHGFGDADAEGWHDLLGFYLRMVDGTPFNLRSIDFRLRVQLQTARVLVTTDLDPTQPFSGQFAEFVVGRFSTFRTLNFTGFENVTQVFISSFLVANNTEQIQWDNIVLEQIVGACCAADGVSCDVTTVEGCTSAGGTYLGDNAPCTNGGYCPTTTGACCSPDAAACAVTRPVDCVLPSDVFCGLGTGCGGQGQCPMPTGACCIDDGAGCLQILEPACTGSGTYFQGAGTLCVEGVECEIPCDVDADCDDADACNGAETCDVPTGQCLPGTPLDCDDQDACSIDACDPVTGCEYTVRDCDDADPCTVDGCDSASGCTPAPVVCSDGDACNGLELCNPASGACEPGTELDCDDHDPCTTDVCDAASGCENIQPDCDDFDPCTIDSCDAAAECVHTALTCDDDDICNGLETCNPETGACDPGTSLTCDDQDACTVDACDPVTGCNYPPLDCDDGDACTADTCNSATGCHHEPAVCDDGNDCTIDSCNPATAACDFTPNDSACDNGVFCDGVETCDGTFGCQPGLPVGCDDGVACTSDSCDELAAACDHAPDHAACDNGVYCDGVETCDGTFGCQPGLPVACDDGVACTIDSCTESTAACDHEASDASCDDGLFCNGPETCNASSGCQAGVDPCGGEDCDEGTDICPIRTPDIWMTFSGSALIPGVGTVQNEDIVAYDEDTGAWSLIFDGSDVGLGSFVIDGMAVLPGGDILLSFTVLGDIPGLTGGPNGLSADGTDIVRFTPTALGATTAGSFSFYFDGSDVGLDTTSENIDAITLAADGRLVISTTANFAAFGASGLDEDLFIFTATSLGAETAGSFELYFDGSDVDLATDSNEDIDAAGIRADGSLLLSTVGPFSVTGLSGADEDAFEFTPTQWGATTAGTYQMILSLSALGIDPTENIASLEVEP